MILYTMVPQELIFQQNTSEFGRQMELTYNGIPLLVEKTDDDAYRIVRVISSNPAHFLDPICIPGNKISLFNDMNTV